MAIKEKLTVSYFPFICSEGETVFCIEQKYGNDGYATWVKILRQLAVTENHYLDLSKKVSMLFLAAKCKVSIELLTEIIEDLVEFGDFNKPLWVDRKIIYCQKFIDNIQDAYVRRKTRCMQFDQLCIHIAYNLTDNVDNEAKNVDNQTHIILDNIILDKKIEDNTKKEKTHDVDIYPTFKDFWDLYEKKVGHDISQKKWEKLTQAEKEKIIQHIPHYKNFQPNPKFRQNPATYLNQKTFNDDIQSIPENNAKQSTSKNGTWLDFARETWNDRQANSGGEPPTQNP